MLSQQQRVQVIAGTIGVLIVAALLLATAVDAAAQGPRFGRGRGGPGGFIGDAGGRGGGLGLMRLGSLTDEQRQQIRTLTDQRREGLAMLAREVAEARGALAASVESGQVDEGKATELGQATSALALARARLHADVLGGADARAEGRAGQAARADARLAGRATRWPGRPARTGRPRWSAAVRASGGGALGSYRIHRLLIDEELESGAGVLRQARTRFLPPAERQARILEPGVDVHVGQASLDLVDVAYCPSAVPAAPCGT